MKLLSAFFILLLVLLYSAQAKISSPTHFYAPFPSQVSVPDFMKFYEDPYTLFEKDLPLDRFCS